MVNLKTLIIKSPHHLELSIMKKYFVQIQTFTLLTIFIFINACNAQIKPNTPKGIIDKQTIKLIKTQGSDIADNVHCGLQDKEGNMWFGTTGEGVYKYDGKKFTQFTVADGLNSNTVWSMLEDKEGKIWIGTSKGLCRYDGKTFSAILINANFDNLLFNNESNYNSTLKNEVWSMMQDKNGKIWFGMSEGVYCYNGKSFTHFLQNGGVINKQNLLLKMVDCIVEDKNGMIWFASGMPPGMEGVCKYDGKEITSFKPNGDGWIRYIVDNKKGKIWFGGRSNENFFYDGKTFTTFTDKLGIGNSILADKAGNIWFTGEEGDNSYESKNGIWRYDGKTVINFSTKEGMGKYFAHCIMEDRNGNIWIGTRNTGLYMFNGKVFTSFLE
jgi:ligand-binding sensor domain-containing protein